MNTLSKEELAIFRQTKLILASLHMTDDGALVRGVGRRPPCGVECKCPTSRAWNALYDLLEHIGKAQV